MAEPLFDFDRPVPRQCQKCGWPFGEGFDGVRRFPLRSVDCPEHMPDHWKYHERKAYEEAMAIQQGERERQAR